MRQFPVRGASALIDPDDLPYLRLLEECARLRRRWGLRAPTPAELEAALDASAPRGDVLPPNVIPFRPRRRPGVPPRER